MEIEAALKDPSVDKNMGVKYNLHRDLKRLNMSTEDRLAAKQKTGLTFEDFQRYRDFCRDPDHLPSDHVYRGYDNLNVTANNQYIPELKKLGDKYIELFKLGKEAKKTSE